MVLHQDGWFPEKIRFGARQAERESGEAEMDREPIEYRGKRRQPRTTRRFPLPPAQSQWRIEPCPPEPDHERKRRCSGSQAPACDDGREAVDRRRGLECRPPRIERCLPAPRPQSEISTSIFSIPSSLTPKISAFTGFHERPRRRSLILDFK